MNHRLVSVLAGLCVFGGIIWFFFSGDTTLTNYPPKNDVIVAFGDSLVEGVGATAGGNFVDQLSYKIRQPIINLGVAGDTTADGIVRMNEVLKEDPGIVLLLLGGNDSLRRVDKETIKENLAQLIEVFQSQGAVVVLLGVRGGILHDSNADLYEELSEEYDTALIDNVLKGLITKPEFMADAIHPNDKGYAIIADRIYEVFEKERLLGD